jgi:hypothetical protein
MKKDQIHIFSYRLNCRMNMSIIEDFMGYWCFICQSLRTSWVIGVVFVNH